MGLSKRMIIVQKSKKKFNQDVLSQARLKCFIIDNKFNYLPTNQKRVFFLQAALLNTYLASMLKVLKICEKKLIVHDDCIIITYAD